MTTLKKTPVYPEYEKYGAKTIDFGGWDLPVQFSGIKEEHEATRTKASLFDVSHMGEIVVRGEKSVEYLQKMTTNDISKLSPKKAHYTFLCNENGGVVDDLIVYMLEENNYLLVVNAANTDKDYEWLTKHNSYTESELEIVNDSDNYAQLAIQGPLAESILQKLTETDLSDIKPFRFESDVAFEGIADKALVSRSGYTGEDGFEIYIAPASVAELWNLILESGKEDGIVPAGLGARDTLRFEANLPLYGQELSETITPVEAGLKFAVKVDKEADFIGKDVLKQQIENGVTRKLVGIEMIDKGIPRTGYDVVSDEKVIGHVTTGTQSPTLKKNIGRALLDIDYTEIGTEVLVQVRKRQLKAKVVATPFYKRDK
ncbi:glycine cleavage system aminomethyltransferase GcvT [Oceanobacillus luteolus]|uniref:Aminomethyltransferase n=1 Tax=Oceanobacillus luteolus TaxID=1274358 RepID=A0ABW4HXU9_9BACI